MMMTSDDRIKSDRLHSNTDIPMFEDYGHRLSIERKKERHAQTMLMIEQH